MNATVEIDKAGRLVVPKKMRDALHLVPGTRVILHQEGESIVIRPDCGTDGLYRKQGLWVCHGPSPVTSGEIRSLIERGRDERERRMLGEDTLS